MSDVQRPDSFDASLPESTEPCRTLQPFMPDEALSEDERDQIEWEKDVLVELTGRRAESLLDSSLNRDARFLEWQARELRGSNAFEGSSKKRLESTRDRVLLRVLAHRAGIQRAIGIPEIRVAAALTSAQNALEEAAREGCAPRVELAVAAGAGRALWDEPCASWVRVPSGLAPGRYIAIDVKGASMEPLLHSGDVILVRPDPVAKRDTVVVARDDDGGYVVKLVRRVSRGFLELASLNSAFPDLRIPYDAGAVVGRVVARWCDHD